jgi:L-ascorbate metabolism protein UlaG (beta-lactamase superfamily)
VLRLQQFGQSRKKSRCGVFDQVVGRIDEYEIREPGRAWRDRPRIGLNDRQRRVIATETFADRSDVLADTAGRFRILLDEYAAGRAPAQRFETIRTAAGKQIKKLCVHDAGSKARENGLAHRVRRRSDRVTFRHDQRDTARPSTGYAHTAREACAGPTPSDATLASCTLTKTEFIRAASRMTPARSDHFNGKTFFQPHHHHAWRRFDLLRWRLTARPVPWPQQVSLQSVPAPAPAGEEVVVTWLGHASFLVQTSQRNFLIDPVFSDRVSPFTWIGPRRVHPPPIALAALPKIDAVLVSHDHYDHLDAATIRDLAQRFGPSFIAPLRHSELLRSLGAREVVELDWWDSHLLAPYVTVTLTPTQHWSNRLGSPRNYRLWGGFYFTFASAKAAKARRLWFVGDTGHAPHLVEAVRQRCGAPDLALVPIGAYEPRWFMAPMHLNPAEAVQLHRDAGARRSVGMHWGTFQLSDEGREAPAEALRSATAAAGLGKEEFRVVSPGESVVL